VVLVVAGSQGPVTILNWSFPRADVSKEVQCKQLALALRDEVIDLANAGIFAIQVDEPAIREGLPLRQVDWDSYLTWAVDSFKLATAGVEDKTSIHSHFCASLSLSLSLSAAAPPAASASVVSRGRSRPAPTFPTCLGISLLQLPV